MASCISSAINKALELNKTSQILQHLFTSLVLGERKGAPDLSRVVSDKQAVSGTNLGDSRMTWAWRDWCIFHKCYSSGWPLLAFYHCKEQVWKESYFSWNSVSRSGCPAPRTIQKGCWLCCVLALSCLQAQGCSSSGCWEAAGLDRHSASVTELKAFSALQHSRVGIPEGCGVSA